MVCGSKDSNQIMSLDNLQDFFVLCMFVNIVAYIIMVITPDRYHESLLDASNRKARNQSFRRTFYKAYACVLAVIDSAFYGFITRRETAFRLILAIIVSISHTIFCIYIIYACLKSANEINAQSDVSDEKLATDISVIV